nr:MAG TPA: hypothetical protein [Caudoviricetes sp.]
MKNKKHSTICPNHCKAVKGAKRWNRRLMPLIMPPMICKNALTIFPTQPNKSTGAAQVAPIK